MKLVEAMYGWNRNSDEIGVGPWPDTTGWSDRYSLTGGACYTSLLHEHPSDVSGPAGGADLHRRFANVRTFTR
jgi:hypothetical protein